MTGKIVRVCIVILAALFIDTTAYSQKISPDEQKILNYIDAHKEDVYSLLQKVVDIESPTQNTAGVKKVGMELKGEFDAIGFKTRWLEMPAEMNRAGHLLAELDGTQGKRLLLLGHIDTVLSGEKFRRDGSRAYGTGSGDMKSGDVILLYALKALQAAGALKDTKIIVMYTGDEEASGKPVELSRGDMVAAARRSDFVLSFEGAVGNNATVGRRGSSSWTLEVAGETGHSSRIFGERMGAGAIFEASRILNQFYEALHNEKYLTFNPSVFVGGSSEVHMNGSSGAATGKTNVVPNKVIIKGDLRFISEEQKESARAKMREIVAKNLPLTSAKISFEDGIPAMTPNEANFKLLRQLDQVSQDLGFGKVEAVDPGDRGAGDIAFVSHLAPSLDGLGGKGGNSHAPGEWADLESMPTLIKRAAILIYRLTR